MAGCVLVVGLSASRALAQADEFNSYTNIQQTSSLPSPQFYSPETGYPYQWMNIHHGGSQGPLTATTAPEVPLYDVPNAAPPFNYNASATVDQSLELGVPWDMLNGTISGLVQTPPPAGAPANPEGFTTAQIDGFSLGNYNPLTPPNANGGALFNHFRDGGFFSWSSPATYDINIGAGSSLTLDDSSNGIAGYPGSYTPAPSNLVNDAGNTGWAVFDPQPPDYTVFQGKSPSCPPNPLPAGYQLFTINGPNAANQANWTQVNDQAGDQEATNNEYEEAPVSFNTQGGQQAPVTTQDWEFKLVAENVNNPQNLTTTKKVNGQVVTVLAPSVIQGPYSIFVNIPQISTAFQDIRVYDAEYSIWLTRAGFNLCGGVAVPLLLKTVRVSQTDPGPNIFVAGPFVFMPGDQIDVVLDNTTNDTSVGINAVVVADSCTLAPVSGTQVAGSPVAINATVYSSDLTNPDTTLATTPRTDFPEIQNVSYYGIQGATTNTADPTPFVGLQDPLVAQNKLGASNNNTGDTYTAHSVRQLVYYGDSELSDDGSHFIGVVYCVDGFRGNIVWRYVCPDGFDSNNNVLNNAVNTTPVVSRLNVFNYVTGQLEPHLVVIVADNLGRIYCLDAIGYGAVGLGQPTVNPMTNGQIKFGTNQTNANLPTPNNNQCGDYTVAQYQTAVADGLMPVGVQCGQPLDGATGGGSATPYIVPTVIGGVSQPSIHQLLASTQAYWIYRPGPQRVIVVDDSQTADINPQPAPAAWPETNDNPPPAAPAVPATDGEYDTATVVASAPTATFTWTFNNVPAGVYTISANIPATATGQTEIRIPDAQYTVLVNNAVPVIGGVGQPGPFTVNQLSPGNTAANILANVPIPQGATVTVTLNNVASAADLNPPPAQTPIVVADSIQLSNGSTSEPANAPPIPQAFNMDSPALFVAPGTSLDTAFADTDTDATNPTPNTFTDPPVAPTPAPGQPPTQVAFLYVTNSNGTLYCFDPTGIPADANVFYGSQQIGNTPTNEPTIQEQWWFPVNGAATLGIPNLATTPGTATIDSGPSIFVPDPVNHPGQHRIFFATSDESDGFSSGRVYAVDSTGPIQPSGAPLVSGALPNGVISTVGTTTGYDNLARPAWAFPDAYGAAATKANPNGGENVITSLDGNKCQPLGDISGTPVPFYVTLPNGAAETRIYFAANSGYEVFQGTAAPAFKTPWADGTYGRIWSVADINDPPTYGAQRNLPQSDWAYPSAWDPNDNTKLGILEPSVPIGAFSYGSYGNTIGNGGTFAAMAPAIGYVQYPDIILNADGSNWVHADVVNNSVNGTVVPMLYAGTVGGTVPKALYALDLYGGQGGTIDDPGATNSATVDQSRQAYLLEAPNGFDFTSSPVLLVNRAMASGDASCDPDGGPCQPGSGGALYVTAGNTLYQIAATPISPVPGSSAIPGLTLTGPFISVDKQFQGFGPLSQPGISAADVQDLETPATGPTPAYSNNNDPNQVTDWVYCGDGSTGFMRGITSSDQENGVSQTIIAEAPVDVHPPLAVDSRYPLHAYIAGKGNNVANHGNNMTPGQYTAGGPGGIYSMNGGDKEPFFDWGQSIYVRITNVVPPNDTGGVADSNPSLRVLDPGDPSGQTYFSNGSPVTYSIQQQPNNSSSGFTDYTANGSVQTLADVPGEGFIVRSTANLGGTGPGYSPGDDLTTASSGGYVDSSLEDENDDPWLYASTYFLGNGTNHSDEPGAVRKIINATQTAGVYQSTDPTSNTPGTLVGTITLTTTTDQGSQYKSSTGQIVQTFPTPDPTFGIGNPLAIGAGGLPLGSGGSLPQAQLLGTLGFQAGSHPLAPEVNPLLDAIANGNIVYQTMPTEMAAESLDPTKQATVQALTPVTSQVDPVNSAGIVADGQSGANQIYSSEDTTDNFIQSGTQGWTLNIADRSLVGKVGMSVNVKAQDNNPGWSDPSTAAGPGAVINPLPWETMPTDWLHGTNTSTDYPDIPATANGVNSVDMILHTNPGDSTQGTSGTSPSQGKSGEMVGSDVTLDPFNPAINGGSYFTDSVATTVNVPIHQPANITQIQLSGSTFPYGYIAKDRVFVDTNHTGKWAPGEVYRDFFTVISVPIDPATHIASNTVDIGPVPHGFGTKMDRYLSNMDGQEGGQSLYPDIFAPYTKYFNTFYQPLNVYNDGNVNLLNVQLDQQIGLDAPGTTNDTPGSLAFLPDDGGFGSDILAYDQTQVPGLNLPNTSIAENPKFQVRSTLDSDLVAAYGQNPRMSSNNDPANGQPWSKLYPGVTFHKPLPFAGSTLLTVPDIGSTDPNSQWYIPYNGGTPSTLGPTAPGLVYPCASGIGNMCGSATIPYVSVAVPVGTSVGTYQQVVRVFDGEDTAFSDETVPTYGGQTPQTGAPPALTAFDNMLNYMWAGPNGQYSPSQPTQPYSDPGTLLRLHVTEAQITDAGSDYYNLCNKTYAPTVVGSLPGLPDYNPTSANPQCAPNTVNYVDVTPAAARDLYWTGGAPQGTGDLGMLWTSGRAAAENNNDPLQEYDLADAFMAASDTTPLYPFVPAASNSLSWWTERTSKYLGRATLPPGTNTGVSMARDTEVYNPGADNYTSDGSDFAFFVNTDRGRGASYIPGTNTGLNSVWCAPYNAATGLGIAVPLVYTGSNDNEAPVEVPDEISGVHGLKYPSSVQVLDPDSLPTVVPIPENLWAFWNVGSGGQSAVYYSAAVAGVRPTFDPPLALKIPDGLGAITDPVPVLITAPDTTQQPTTQTGNVAAFPSAAMIEVTYSASTQGATNIYVSRYRPFLDKSNKDASGNPLLSLRQIPYPPELQELGPDGANNWWSARDVAWARYQTLPIQLYVNGQPMFAGTGITYTYDKSSGFWIVTGGVVSTGVNTTQTVTVYMDMPHGRVRFSPSLTSVYGTTVPTVVAYVAPMARRITTDDDRPNNQATALIDNTYKANERPYPKNAATGLSSAPRAQANRYWFIWRKSGSSSASTPPRLYYSTQRLGMQVYLQQPLAAYPDTGGDTVSNLSSGSATGGTFTVFDNTKGESLYQNGSAGDIADIDWVRGRIYLPMTDNAGNSLDGDQVTVTCTGTPAWTPDQGGTSTNPTTPQPVSIVCTDFIHWIDEPRYNDPATGGQNGSYPTVSLNVNGSGLAYYTAIAPTTSNEAVVPMNTAVNEYEPDAFLDPLAYADEYAGAIDLHEESSYYGTVVPDQPHKLWLFWTSNRNGRPDIYYEAFNPNFSANPLISP